VVRSNLLGVFAYIRRMVMEEDMMVRAVAVVDKRRRVIREEHTPLQ
jgi:hypothetical protein